MQYALFVCSCTYFMRAFLYGKNFFFKFLVYTIRRGNVAFRAARPLKKRSVARTFVVVILCRPLGLCFECCLCENFSFDLCWWLIDVFSEWWFVVFLADFVFWFLLSDSGWSENFVWWWSYTICSLWIENVNSSVKWTSLWMNFSVNVKVNLWMWKWTSLWMNFSVNVKVNLWMWKWTSLWILLWIEKFTVNNEMVNY